jgi:hypothetical protein
MIIFGKPLSEYVSFGKLFLILVPLAGIVRLLLSLQGCPADKIRWVSMTILGFIGVIYFAVRIQTTGFGGYKELLVLCTLQNLTSQVVSIAGILQSMASGVDNIYTIPEAAFGANGRSWSHVLAHVFIGSTLGSVAPWLLGCLILFVVRKVMGGGKTALNPR